MNGFRSRPLSGQIGALRAIGFAVARGSGSLVARGQVRPTPLSDQYRLVIEYDQGFAPRTYVQDPELHDRGDGEPIPHIYPGPRPCLYHPKSREWMPWMLIARTIVPWAMLWLVFYEAWLVTGEWEGGGVDHSPDKPKVDR